LQLRWFDRWLRGIKNGIDEQPPVELFVMGQNRWRSENEWPLARTKYTPWYLQPDRGLGPEPAVGAHSDAFAYDPRNPVPTRGGNHLLPAHYPRGPVDQREVEARADVLTYTSPLLEHDLEVTGPVAVKLWAVSSAPSTDFTAKLVDVFPDGRAFNVCDGIVRVKEGAREPREHIIELWATSNAFLRGHRLRVEISSSNFPRFDRNLNTGLSGRDSGETAVAQQTIFSGADRASCIVLPVIE
jgi:putative CocE/NonD family hydrolase